MIYSLEVLLNGKICSKLKIIQLYEKSNSHGSEKMTLLPDTKISRRRNIIIKQILLFIVLLSVCCGVTYFYRNYLIKQFITKGRTAVTALAAKCQVPMLKYAADPSELPRVPRDAIKDTNYLNYTLISRYDIILDRSDDRMILRKYNYHKDKKLIQTDGSVFIYEEKLESMRVITFSAEITTLIGNAKLGKIFISYNASVIDNKVLLIFLSSLAACAVFLIFIWAVSMKKSKKEDDFEHIKNFRLTKPIKDGGMANLWVAVSDDDSLGKEYAVKVAKPDLPPDTLQTFDDEALLVSGMDHSNIVKVHFYFEDEHAIVMDYVEGDDLGIFLTRMRGSLSTEHIVYIILEVCEGLMYAHALVNKETKKEMNIVHRDIKPANILIADDGGVKITDFGIAKANIFDPDKTRVGDVKGTLTYMSPEQALGEKNIDRRSDIYSLGIIFYEMLTGRRLHNFDSNINFTTAIRIVSEKEIPPVKEKIPNISEELNQIVMKCLEKEKGNRYQNIEELKNDLNVFLSQSETPFSKAEIKISLTELINEYKLTKTVKVESRADRKTDQSSS